MDKYQCNSNLHQMEDDSISMGELSTSIEEIMSSQDIYLIFKPPTIEDFVNKTNVEYTATNRDIFNEIANNKVEFMSVKNSQESPVSLCLDDIHMKQNCSFTNEGQIDHKLLTDTKLKENKLNSALISNQEIIKISKQTAIPNANTMRTIKRCNKNYSNLIQMYCTTCNKATINYFDRKCMVCQALLLFQCVTCESIYKRLITIQNHIKYDCHRKTVFYCNDCNFESLYKMHLITHIQTEHSMSVSSKESYMCSICHRKFSNENNMLSHERICSHELILRCKHCLFKTKFSYILIKHIELKHKKHHRKNYLCSCCGKKYEYLKSLNRHTATFCGRKLKLKCDHCNYTTDKKYSLAKHIQQNHSELFFKNKFVYNF